MCRRHSPAQQLTEAKQIAKDHGYFVGEQPTHKGLRYLLYRKQRDRSVYVGWSGSPEGIRKLVCKVTNFK